MRSKFKWIFALFIAFTMQFSYSQEKTISGAVSDVRGNPVVGANIALKGSPKKVQTGFDGKFSIKGNVGDILIFSFVGMQEISRTIGSSNSISVKMSENGVSLSEVVIQNNFGYFKKDSNKILAAVSVVGGAEIVKQSPSMTALNALQGKAAGVQVTSRNGQPGQGAYVNIRGAVSITGSPNSAGQANGNYAGATYVVDGAYMREEEFSAISGSDIENMTVLKDGASAAIYGIRGGNGVVVVTTKRGTNTKPKFELSTSYGFADNLKDPVVLMTGIQKLSFEKTLQEGPGFDATAPQLALLQSYEHDWRKDLIKTASIENVNFSVRGGSDKISSFFSVGVLRNTGNVKNLDGYKRFNANLTTDYKATDKFTIGVNVRGAYERTTLSRDRYNAQNPFYATYAYNGYEPLYDRDANGNILLDANGNPLFNLTSAGFPVAEAILNNLSEERFFKGYLRPYMKYNLIKGLDFETNLSLNYERRQAENFILPGSVLDQFVGNPSSPGSKNDQGYDRLETQFVNQLNYQFKLGQNHNFGARALYEYQSSNFRGYSTSRTGFVGNYATAGVTPTLSTTSRTEAIQYSVFGGLDYDYNGKYILSFSGRNDYSSLLGKNNRSKFAKGGSIGWVVSKENFMKSAGFIDFLKLRASFGQLNSILGVDRYANIANFTTTNYGGALATTYLNQNAGSPEIGFEQAEKLDFGIETRLFKDRLSLSGSYFKDKRDGFIFNGFTQGSSLNTLVNAGAFTVKGYELEFKAFLIKKSSMNLSIYANAAKFDRVINTLNKGADLFRGGFNIQREGYSPDAFYLVRYAGVDKTNGDALYYDLNGVASNVYSTLNRVVSDKSPYAKYEGGFGLEFDYKGFDMSSDFVFKQGNYIYNLRYSDLVSDGNNILSNQAVDAFDYWTAANTNASLPAPFQFNSNNVDRTSDRFLEDGSYVRFRNLNIGYSISKNTFKNFPLDKVRFYTQIQNLYTWSKFKGDPEVGIGNLEQTTVIPGAFQGYSYPNVKTVMFGLTVNF